MCAPAFSRVSCASLASVLCPYRRRTAARRRRAPRPRLTGRVWLEHEMPQHAAESLLEIGLSEDLLGPTGRKNRAVQEDRTVAEFGHAAKIVGRDQHNPALVAQAPRSSIMAYSVLTSTPVKGSSRSMTRPSWARARARKTRFFCPPDSSPIWRLRNAFMSTRSSAASTAWWSAPGDAQEVHVAIAAHHHHVLDEDGEVPVDSSLCGT